MLISSDRRFLWICVVLLAIIALQGGASRSTEPAALVVRIAAIVAIVAALWRPRPQMLRRHAALLVFAGACALVPIVQLIPLPPSVWTSLSGRDVYAAVESAAGLAPQWRPISLTPALTLDSLYAMLPPVAVLIAAASMTPQDRAKLAVPMLVIALVSAVIGLLQLGGGLGSFYRTGNKEGFAIGLFANRNHNATLLACALPLAALVMPRIARARGAEQLAAPLTIAVAVFLIAMILLVGSRAGMIAGVVGAVLAVVIYDRGTPAVVRRPARARSATLRRVGAAVGLVAVAGATFWIAMSQSRAVAWQRLLGSGSDEEIRVARVEPLWDAAITFFPFGSGQGSFRTVFERFEPFDQLRLTHANMAHNDPLQIVIEGGLPAVLLAAAFLWWFAGRLWSAYRPGSRAPDVSTARTGGAIVLIALIASAVDYPLRTPLYAAIVVIACLWLSDARAPTGGRAGGNMVA